VRLFSYVVARDYGFAPNPFGAFCTLATCKPRIRAAASVGDWIVGLSSASDKPDVRLVFVMRVEMAFSYDQYWNDPRFQYKKPSRFGSLKQAFGDNIYHRARNGKWLQADSHHSCDDGSPNRGNIDNDTKADRVLIATRFAYWGSEAPKVPSRFLDFRGTGTTIAIVRGHKSDFPTEFIKAFVTWFEGLDQQGYLGPPFRWTRPGAVWARHPAA
jgi:hypothetical protein